MAFAASPHLVIQGQSGTNTTQMATILLNGEAELIGDILNAYLRRRLKYGVRIQLICTYNIYLRLTETQLYTVDGLRSAQQSHDDLVRVRLSPNEVRDFKLTGHPLEKSSKLIPSYSQA